MLRELTKDEAAVLDAFRRQTVRGAFTAGELAGPDVSVNTIEKIQKGDMQLAVAKLRALFRVARRRDPNAALDFLADVLGCDDLGLVVSVAPRAEAAGALVFEAAQAGVAVGEAQAAVLRAASDGEVSPDEAQEIRRAARRAEREVVALAESARRFEARAQPALAFRRSR
jgi:hypothetical protein